MRRADIVDGELHVIQDKTGAELYLPDRSGAGARHEGIPCERPALIGTENGSP